MGRAKKKTKSPQVAPGRRPDSGFVDNGRARMAPEQALLGKYIADIADVSLMAPDVENRCAMEIVELETEIWRRIFGYPPTVEVCVELCVELIPESARKMRGLLRSLQPAQDGSQGLHSVVWAQRVNRVAGDLRWLDRDRKGVEALIAELETMNRGGPRGDRGRGIGFRSTGSGWGDFLAGISRAQQAARHARQRFIEANLRLVVSIARRYNHGRMALADLIQEGNLGLIKAVDRYDHRRGYRFSTYASWWIRHAVGRAVADKGRQVRLPVHVVDTLYQLRNTGRELEAKLGRAATLDELAQATGIGIPKIKKMAEQWAEPMVSLHSPVQDMDGRSLIDVLPDAASMDNPVGDRLHDERMTSALNAMMDTLRPIEADILRQRFGFDSDSEMTLKEIGKKYHLSRERIRQLQEQALEKLRHAAAARQWLWIPG